jgi:hypothetical protein
MKLHAHFEAKEIIPQLVTIQMHNTAYNLAKAHVPYQSTLINTVGITEKNPALAIRYIHRLHASLDDYPEVVLQQHKKSIRWMVSNEKTLEFADEVCVNQPELQAFLAHELFMAKQLHMAMDVVRKYGLHDVPLVKTLVDEFTASPPVCTSSLVTFHSVRRVVHRCDVP